MGADREGDGWAALGDPTRRAIVASLAERPRAVGELAAGLPVSRPAVSQALKVLRDAGLVDERAVGTRRVYRLRPAAVAALRDQLDTYWSRALANYGDVVAQADPVVAQADPVAPTDVAPSDLALSDVAPSDVGRPPEEST